MKQISWDQLERNAASGEIGFETFVYQIVHREFSSYGYFEYPYNTPGSEFYLNLTMPCPNLDAVEGDVVGWQCKFWRGADDTNSPLTSAHREELETGLKNSRKYRPKLKVWIVCTPGHFSDTLAGNQKTSPLQQLKAMLTAFAPEVRVRFWHKEEYESFLIGDMPKYQGIWNYYFSTKLLSGSQLNQLSKARINYLKAKYDADLYTPGEVDTRIRNLIRTPVLEQWLKKDIARLRKVLKSPKLLGQPESSIEQLLNDSRRLAHKIVKNDHGRYGMQDASNLRKSVSDDFGQLVQRYGRMREQSQKHQEGSATKQITLNQQWQEAAIIRTEQLLRSIDELLWSCELRNSRYAYVFGRAGYGKTCLVCNLAEELIASDLPCALLLGRDFRSTGPRQTMLSMFDLEQGYTFDDLLAGLDALGLHYGMKVPIIIDGLNESFPTADVWASELVYIKEAIAKYENVFFLATCRQTYCRQVFGVNGVDEIESAYQLEGFSDKNIDTAVDKYFQKYQISADITDVDNRLLRNPLLLKMFCVVNRGRQVSVHGIDIYQVFENYIRDVLDRASTEDSRVNHAVLNRMQSVVLQFCTEIWVDCARGLDYPSRFVGLFSKAGAKEELYQKLLDEDLFIARQMQGDQETVEFTFEALAGYCIAKYVVLEELNRTKSMHHKLAIVEKLKPASSNRHPLFDDILRTLVHLIAKNGVDSPFVLLSDSQFSPFLITLINDTDEAWRFHKSFLHYSSSLAHGNESLKLLCNTFVSNIVNDHSYCNFDIFEHALKKFDFVQLNIIWAEVIREHRVKIAQYLWSYIENTDALINDMPDGDLEKILRFTGLVFATTSRHLRDVATKAFVQIGKRRAALLLPCFNSLSTCRDPYVKERVLAGILGALSSQRPDFAMIDALAWRVYKTILKDQRCCHLLILDYAQSICALARFYDAGPVIDNSSIPRRRRRWKLDHGCSMSVIDHQTAEWGYQHIHMDFAKYVIGHVASKWITMTGSRKSQFQKLLTLVTNYLHRRIGIPYIFEAKPALALQDALAMAIHRTRQLGYSEGVFKVLDDAIANEGKNHDRMDNTYAVERYGKKFSWIAYFELYGFLLVNGIQEPCYPDTLRTSSIDIDPSFPIKPSKLSPNLKCYLKPLQQSTQAWIDTELSPYLKPYYICQLRGETDNWTLLHARVQQESKDKDRFECFLQSFLVDSKDLQTIEREIAAMQDFTRLYHVRAPEYYYLSASEMYWRRIRPQEEPFPEEMGIKGAFYSPIVWYTWESYHSSQNQTGPLPFLCHDIVKSLTLGFDINKLEYRTPSGVTISRYAWDSSSEYLFIRTPVINEYCRDNGLSILWVENGTRWGDYGNRESHLNPSYKDFRHFEAMTIS